MTYAGMHDGRHGWHCDGPRRYLVPATSGRGGSCGGYLTIADDLIREYLVRFEGIVTELLRWWPPSRDSSEMFALERAAEAITRGMWPDGGHWQFPGHDCGQSGMARCDHHRLTHLEDPDRPTEPALWTLRERLAAEHEAKVAATYARLGLTP